MMEFFNVTLSKKTHHIYSNSYLLCESAHNHQIFTNEKAASLASYIRKINTTLSNGTGLIKAAFAKLLTLLPQCPQSVINTEGERWIRLCFQRLSHDDISTKKAIFTILTILFKCCHENKEILNKVSKLDTKLITKLYLVDDEVRESAFKCLYEFLRLFPSQSLSYKREIEEKLMPILALPLSSKDKEAVYCAGQIYAALPVPGGSSGAAEVKGSHLDQLISLCHSATDALFHSVKENEKYDFTREHKLPLKTLENVLDLNDPLIRLLKSAPLLGNCLVFLKAFLEKCTFRLIKIKAKELIRVAFRILQVEVVSLRDSSSMELIALSFILPSIHMRAVEFLKALVENKVCGLFMNVVEEQLVSTLKGCNPSLPKSKTGDASSNQSRLQHNSMLRILCYETLTQAIKVSNGNHKGLLEGLISNLLNDVSPVKDSISLKSAVRGGKLSLISVKKKSKKKGYTVTSDDSQTHATEIAHSQIVEQRIPVTIAALELVEALFLHSQHSNPTKYIKILQDRLLLLLNTIHTGVYKDPHVRAKLFSAVNAFALYPNPYCPPDYGTITDAFTRENQQNPHPKVKEICTRGLAIIAFITSNPNVTNWSEIVQLRKECQNIKLNEDEEPILLNDQMEDEESDEEEDNRKKMNENEKENSSDDDDEDEDDDDDDNDDEDHLENGMEVNGEEDDENGIAVNGDEDEVDEENTNITLETGDDCEDKDEDDDISEPSLESSNDFGSDVAESDGKEDWEYDESSENDEKYLPSESDVSESEESKDQVSVSKRRQTEQSGSKYKKNKTDDEEVTPSVSEMMAAFVDADPDGDSD